MPCTSGAVTRTRRSSGSQVTLKAPSPNTAASTSLSKSSCASELASYVSRSAFSARNARCFASWLESSSSTTKLTPPIRYDAALSISVLA